MALRISEEIDLKELENILDGDVCIQSNVYCCVKPNDIEYIENNCIQDYEVQFYINKEKEIDFCTYPEERDTRFILDTLYDLIKANIVIKE